MTLAYDQIKFTMNPSPETQLILAVDMELAMNPILPTIGLTHQIAKEVGIDGGLTKFVTKNMDLQPGTGAYANVTGSLGESQATSLGATGEAQQILQADYFTSKSGTRIADYKDGVNKIITEVKNVASQNLTPQLRDMIKWSITNGYSFQLMTRSTTHITKPLQELVDKKFVKLIQTLE